MMKYNISPFSEGLALKSELTDQIFLKSYLDKRFGDWCYTEKAREAIKVALSYYHLEKNDVVTILTTSGNFYISSCVTNAIESVCKWSREIVSDTKVLFVNHEFGYPYENIEDLKEYGLPIIEDCAYAFFTESDKFEIGKIGDFAIYSLPKAFPVEKGGILVSNNDSFVLSDSLEKETVCKLNEDLASVIYDIDTIKEKRFKNYHYLLSELKSVGIDSFFKLKEGVVPGVFLFKWRDDIDYPALKVYMQNNGVECSVFYGENAFFIPMHHLLEKQDLDTICGLLKDNWNK